MQLRVLLPFPVAQSPSFQGVGNRQPEAEALYDATGYTRIAAEPLPDWGPFRPIAFEKWLA